MTIRSRWADSDWTLVRDLEKQAKIKGPKRTPFSHWRRGQSACNDDTIALGRLGLDFSEGSGKTGENKGAQKDPFFSLAERVGFEPTKGYKPLLVFKTSAFDHSATSPNSLIPIFHALH